MIGFYKSFCPFSSKNLHTHSNPSQNIPPILILDGLVMVTNEWPVACKCVKKQNVREYSL